MSSKSRIVPTVLFALVLVIIAAPISTANAQASCPVIDDIADSMDAIEAFERLRLGLRLGDSQCDSALCNDVAAWESLPPGDSKVSAATILLDAIRESALRLPNTLDGVRVVQNRLVQWQQLLATGDIATLPIAVWKPAQFVLFTGHEDSVDFEPVLLAACPTTVGECREAFEVAMCTYSHAVAQRRVLVGLIEQDRTDTIQYLDRLNKRWTAFNSGGRSLFPWELAINGAIHERRVETRGFVEPPTKQWIIAHPGIAIDYANSRSGGIEEAIALEVVGWYQWRWGGADGATMKRPFGASLIATWTGGAGGDVGYGVMFHLPRNWSIGVSRRSVLGEDETTVLVSVDLGKFLLKENTLRGSLIEQLKEVAK